MLTLIQTGKSPLVPVILLDVPGGSFWQDALDFIRKQLEGNHYILPSDMKLLTLVHSADEAVEQINQFYGNYHSSRWLKKLFVIRMHHSLTEPALAHLDEAFKDLCLSGGFHQHGYDGEEHDEPQFSHLARLAFTFNARDQGRLRELVDYINLPENWAMPLAQPLTQPARSREPLKVT
ncbi:putative lysine decarboxylase [compost metagenome]